VQALKAGDAAASFVDVDLTNEAVGGGRWAIVAQTLVGCMGAVADMADAVVFPCFDAFLFIMGARLPVDGGMGM
jgi:NAD(P)-dependent dehydrogenase (short-subunit alcohol dehydrogenase family)